MGFWSHDDRQQQQALRVDTQPAEQAAPQRHTERAHHQIESALHARVQGLHALVQEIEQTVDYMPQDVQSALLTPLADLHSQLCGLVYVAWSLSLLHLHADDHDQWLQGRSDMPLLQHDVPFFLRYILDRCSLLKARCS